MANAKALKLPRSERGDFTAAAAATTLTAGDSGKTFAWNHATALLFTLPAVQKSQKGIFYHFIVNIAATSGTGHGVSPASVDKIIAPGVTATDDKDIYFATAADYVGDGFTLISDGTDGWYIQSQNGTIVQES
jgi:hypothetical protein|tara:strand:+ start:3680 stop:4078 length:399 start_codon:yes stop_codon:yes gene_type:complete